MTSEKLVRQNAVPNTIVEDLASEGISSQQREEDISPEQEKLNELLKKDKEESKGEDPMEFPPDYTYLIKELGKKGGIRMDNCQEINVISHTIYESKLDARIKDNCIKILEHMINYSNLWIIHYNKHK